MKFPRYGKIKNVIPNNGGLMGYYGGLTVSNGNLNG